MRTAMRGVLRFLLSHHFEDELGRCFRVGGLHVCARCLGVYPVLAATFAALVLAGAPREHVLDPLWIFVLPGPAFFDWREGRYDPTQGSNLRRLVTGALAGLGFGRALYVLARWNDDPRPWILFGTLAVLAAWVELRSRRYRNELGG